jgi:predicted type IV restriction endonuclease
MPFEKEVKNFKDKLPKVENIDKEENTAISLINPFLKLLGYDYKEPEEVKHQYNVEVNQSSGKKIVGVADIIILDSDSKPEIVIECKRVDKILNNKHQKQLKTYFDITGSRIGILTNGIIYKFFTSINKGMDKEPFLVIDLNNLTNEDITDLKCFKKEEYNFKKILSKAKLLQYTIHFEKHLKKEINYPSDDFIKLITEKFYKKDLGEDEIKKFKKAILNKFKNFEFKEKPKPPLIVYNGLGKREFNKFFEIYNNLPQKFKSKKPPIIAKRFKKYGKWETMEKGVLYANKNTNIIMELFTKYFMPFIPKYEDEIAELIKHDNMFQRKSAKMFAKYVTGDKLNTEEKKLLDKIFSE